MELKLDDFETKMIYNGKRNVRHVKVRCEFCGKEFWKVWQRVKTGARSFCSRECCNKWQDVRARKEARGWHNARFYWNDKAGRWDAHWRDETGRLHNTTKARWLWLTYVGEIPEGLVVWYKDNNPRNCEIGNLELITRKEMERRKRIALREMIKIPSSYKARRVKRQNLQRLALKLKSERGMQCEVCGSTSVTSRTLHMHHINADPNDNSDDNLILLCSKCHLAVHGNILPTRGTEDYIFALQERLGVA